MASAADPLVSVLVPAYNGEMYIAEAIESVLGQDYSNIEIIVIDDGSTDRTCEIVRSYAGRVRLLEQKNQGAAFARNLGIKAARGSYIAFLDADDVWWHKKLSTQVRALADSGYKMAYSRFIVWQADSQGQFGAAQVQFETAPHPRLFNGAVVSGWNYSELLMDCVVWTSTVIIDTAELKKSGLFDTRLRKGQDYDLWLRLSRQLTMLGLQQPTALYRTHRGSVTHKVTDECYEYSILAAAVERWGERGPDQRAPAAGLVQDRLKRILFNHGIAHYRWGRMDIAVETFTRLLKKHGFHFKACLYLVLSLLKK